MPFGIFCGAKLKKSLECIQSFEDALQFWVQNGPFKFYVHFGPFYYAKLKFLYKQSLISRVK